MKETEVKELGIWCRVLEPELLRESFREVVRDAQARVVLALERVARAARVVIDRLEREQQ